MREVSEALGRAARSQFEGRMLGVALWPLLGALLFWTVAIWLAWPFLYGGLKQITEIAEVAKALEDNGLGWLPGALWWILALLVMPALVMTTAIFITSAIAMPIAVEHVAGHDYGSLSRARGGSVAGSVVNASVALLAYLGLWIVTLPFALVLPILAVLPLALGGYLNARLFRYDALAEHASAEERQLLIARHGTDFYLLGCIAAGLQLVPVVNLLTPVYSGLSFIHYSLAALQRLRGTAGGTLLRR